MKLFTRFRPARISYPAIFGKLPCHGDYIRWHVSAEEEKDWLDWLNRQTWLGDGFTPAPNNKNQQNKKGWLDLTPEFTVQPNVHDLPWCFVLQPGVLPFSGSQWVVGVITASRDSVGRAWPLVSYQRVHRQWLVQHLEESQGWLFWQSRLVHYHVALPEPVSAGERQLTEQLTLLWSIHRPHWWSRMTPQELIRKTQSQALLNNQIQDMGLSGVAQMPWGEWPQRVWLTESTGLGWFWQQDSRGAYLDAKCFSERVLVG